MRYDQSAVEAAKRDAFILLTTPFQEIVKPDGKREQLRNKFAVKPEQVTAPATLIQEIDYTNQTNIYQFDFSINGQPAGSNAPGTNNVILGKNNVAVIWGLKILQGQGATNTNRIYRSRGITPNDDSLYNSVVSVKFENSTLVDKIEGQSFRDRFTNPNEFDGNMGMVLWRPLRVVTGEVGTFQVNIQVLGSMAGLVLTDDVKISVRPMIVFGQASAVR